MARTQPQGQKPAKANDAVAIAEPEESPFRHYIPGEKPKADQAYFELLLLRVYRAGGDIADFDQVWPRAIQALAGVNLLRLSTYGPSDVREAITSVGGEFSTRMGGHAEAIIRWAESFWRIRQVYGTFRRYVRSFESDGFEALLDDLRGRLPGLSPEFLTAYLREAGEKVPAPEKPSPPRPQTPARAANQQEARVNEPRGQKPQEQPRQDGTGGDRRRRQRGRGGSRQPQQQGGSRRPQQAAAVTSDQTVAAQSTAETPAKNPLQQQRRRNRRRFFRRRRAGGGDKPGGSAAASN
jgi:hypothetical protein